MKAIVILFLLSTTGFLFGASFYLAIQDKPMWSYYLAAGIFSMIVSSSVSSTLAGTIEEEVEESTPDK